MTTTEVSKGLWVKSEDTPKDSGVFTADELLSAYNKGKRDGAEMSKKAIRERIHSNILRTSEQTEKVAKHLKKMNFHPLSAHLQIKTAEDFCVLITVPEDEFISDAFLNVYTYISNFERRAKSKNYNITFSFINKNEHFDEDHLLANGYRYKHQRIQ